MRVFVLSPWLPVNHLKHTRACVSCYGNRLQRGGGSRAGPPPPPRPAPATGRRPPARPPARSRIPLFLIQSRPHCRGCAGWALGGRCPPPRPRPRLAPGPMPLPCQLQLPDSYTQQGPPRLNNAPRQLRTKLPGPQRRAPATSRRPKLPVPQQRAPATSRRPKLPGPQQRAPATSRCPKLPAFALHGDRAPRRPPHARRRTGPRCRPRCPACRPLVPSVQRTWLFREYGAPAMPTSPAPPCRPSAAQRGARRERVRSRSGNRYSKLACATDFAISGIWCPCHAHLPRPSLPALSGPARRAARACAQPQRP